MRRLLSHEAACVKFGPTQEYVNATQPRWITIVHRLGTALLILGCAFAVASVAHLVWFDLRRPHLGLTALAVAGLGVGALALLPMLIFRSAKGLPVVQDGRFVTLTGAQMVVVIFAYVVVFFVALPLAAQDMLGGDAPELLEDLARLSANIMSVLKFFF